MRRPEAEIAVVAILEAQQLLAVALPASALLPQLRRAHGRHEDLLRPGALHLLAQDALDLAQHAHAERQEIVDAAGHLADHAGAQQELVTHHLGLGGDLAERRDQQSGVAHEGVRYSVRGGDCHCRHRGAGYNRVPLGAARARTAPPMDFGFTTEQEMLRDAARKFLASECPPAVARAAMSTEDAHDPARWRALAELGWLGILVPAELGGQGGAFLDMAVVLEESGKTLLPGPFFASALLGTLAIRDAGSPAQRARLLPALASGARIATVALPPAGEEPAVTLTTDGRASGEARFVMDAAPADVLVLAVRDGGGAPGLALVERHAGGVEVTPLHSVDMTRRLCRVALRRAPGERLERADPAATMRRLAEHACAGLALELVGSGQRALEMAVAYAGERMQFGRPIGSFQAIKHKCVDMMVRVETARALAYYAAWAVSDDAPDAARAAAMAKAYAGEMARTVTSEAIQVHGGIGFTWEHDLHLYYRRALAADAAFGAAPAHRETIVAPLVR